LECIANSAAADVSAALDEDKHPQHDDETIHDLLGIVDDTGDLESSGIESSEDESPCKRPMSTSQNSEQLLSPVDFGINQYNDDVDVNVDDDDDMVAQIQPMPSLDAYILLQNVDVAAATTVSANVNCCNHYLGHHPKC
jgi:hypothetical protein